MNKHLLTFILSVLCCGFLAPANAQQKTLSNYLDQALTNSPLLKDLQNQVLQNQIDSAKLKATFRPMVNASSTGTYAPLINGYGYDAALSNAHTFNALVNVSQALTGKKNIAAQVESIRLLSESARAATGISEKDVRKAITAQYITAFGSMKQMNFNKEVCELLNREEAALRQLTKQNVYKQTEYLTFLVTLKQQELQLKQSEILFKNDFATLNYLAGINDTTAVQLQEPALANPNIPDFETSAFARQFHIDSLKLSNSKTLVDMAYKPKASVYIDGGVSTAFGNEAYKNVGTSVGFTISMPIYDGKQRKMNYNKIAIQEKTRLNYKDFASKQYQQQIAQVQQQIKETQSLKQQITDQVKYAESLIRVDARLLQTGDLRIADYVIAINSYMGIKNLLTQTHITQLQLINQLNYWNRQ